ncbi:MAG: M3 family metallopeptidase [Bacteroidales bacterium]|nr:M3 family metallopeptidase [Candidatus Colimorpha onthohippi]
MKKILLTTLAAILLLAGCKNKEIMTNPLLSEWNTPYGIPDFKQIKAEHYLPAFDTAMAIHKAEIDAIINNPETPSFANTIEALDRSGELINNICNIFFNLNECESNDEMEQIANEVMPRITAHNDDIYLNADLFARVKAVYELRDSLGLNEEQARLLEETYKGFVRGGANVAAENQKRFREINEQMASLTLRFGQNVLKATNAFQLVLEKEDLDGLTTDQIAAAKEAADANESTKGKYVFGLQMPSWEPFMTNSSRRDLRKKMWDAYANRCNGGEFDNSGIIDSLVNLRIERAHIMGYKTHADFVLDDRLAKTPKAVYDLLLQIWKPALQKAKQECAEYQDIVKDEGDHFDLEPCDWRYYSEKVRKAKYALNDEEIRPYFSLDGVLDGAFGVATKLYGLQFRLNKQLPTYNAEAQAYEVIDNGEVIGILYMDFYPRESKRSGAWMTSFRNQYIDANGKNVIPIIQVVCNFTKPTADKPSLLTFDESETLFHEFGHALHGLLSKCTYQTLSGTAVPCDFVELPSQIMENWCRHPEVMKQYAKHYKSGESIPDSLIAKIAAAQTYGQGFINTELLAASLLDMDYHSLSEQQPIVATDFENASMKRLGLIPQIISRYKSHYFQHIFMNSYDAGYYSYTWTAVLDADAFEAFKESGDLFNPELAKKFRHILESGNSRDCMTMYREFRGKDPDVKPLLRNRGLL